MMLKVLFCVFVLYGAENVFTARVSSTRSCLDCVSIRSCDAGLQYANLLVKGMQPFGNRQTFLNAICGYEVLDARIPKVCCSDFGMVNYIEVSPFMPEISNLNMPDPIERHRNLNLLPTSCGEIHGARLLDGKFAKLYEFPWMALIAYQTRSGIKFGCGGTMINSRYILTAAHCIKDSRTGRLKRIAGVRLGELDYNTNNDCQEGYQDMICESKFQDIEVEEYIPHQEFNGMPLSGFDIGLLRLKYPINIENNVSPICLPLHDELRNTQLEGLTATIAGWSITENQTTSSKLMKADILIKSKDDCDYYYNRYGNNQHEDLLEKIFCAGKKDKDSCEGDSGGPLMIESDYNGSRRLVQYGIEAYSLQQCDTDFPVVYTNVTKYMKWILDNIRE